MADTAALTVEKKNVHISQSDDHKPIVKPEIEYLPEQRRLLRIVFSLVLSFTLIVFLALMYFTEGILWRVPKIFQGLFAVGMILIVGICIVIPLLLTTIYMMSGWIKILPPNIVYVVLAPFVEPKVKGPGTFWLFWPLQRADVEVRKRQFPLLIENVITTSGEGWPLLVNGQLEYVVIHPIPAAYNPGNLELSIRLLAESIIFDIASTKKFEYLRKHKEELSKTMLEKIRESLKKGMNYGIDIEMFSLVDAELATEEAVSEYLEAIAAERRAKSFETMFASVKNKMPDASQKQVGDMVAKLQIAAKIGPGTNVLVSMEGKV